MRWQTGALLTSCAVLAIGGMIQTRTSLTELKRERRALQTEQAQMREALTILRAEYAHLTNPQRLERLATSFKLTPLMPKQLSSWEAL